MRRRKAKEVSAPSIYRIVRPGEWRTAISRMSDGRWRSTIEVFKDQQWLPLLGVYPSYSFHIPNDMRSIVDQTHETEEQARVVACKTMKTLRDRWSEVIDLDRTVYVMECDCP